MIDHQDSTESQPPPRISYERPEESRVPPAVPVVITVLALLLVLFGCGGFLVILILSVKQGVSNALKNPFGAGASASSGNSGGSSQGTDYKIPKNVIRKVIDSVENYQRKYGEYPDSLNNEKLKEIMGRDAYSIVTSAEGKFGYYYQYYYDERKIKRYDEIMIVKAAGIYAIPNSSSSKYMYYMSTEICPRVFQADFYPSARLQDYVMFEDDLGKSDIWSISR